MFGLLSIEQDRPSRLESNKDESYHAKFGRYCVGRAYTGEHEEWLRRTYINKMFYQNKQWVYEEDLESFFKDDDNNERNRLKVTQNIIQPMVEQYRGNAIRMSINARCRSISPKSINRREEGLAKMEFLTDLSQESPFQKGMKKKFPIGDTVEETRQIFDNVYVDKFIKEMNSLLKYVSELNNFENMRFRVAEEMAWGGISIIQDREHGGHQRFEVVPSTEFFFDRTAREYDLQDGEFMGRGTLMLPTEIFEQFQIEDENIKKKIEDYCKSFNNISENYGREVSSGRLPVAFAYWKDSERYTYAYVKDEFGYPYLTRINYIYPGEETPRYTDADIIEVNSQRAQKLLKGKNKKNLSVDEIRYCIFIPKEVAGDNKKDSITDIVLEHGLMPYQETDLLDISNCKFPYKAFCWSYIDGEIISPVDAAINPQRLINRISSIAENQINNSGGAGITYDHSALPVDGEEGMLRKINQGKPVGFDSRGRGIQNSVGYYDSTPKQGTYALFNLIPTLQQMSQNTTGINDALQGQSMGSEQLVGVTQLMIQRGSLMQEPYYNAITQVFLQCYQAIASRGKRIYIDNERELAIATGDDGVEIIKLSKELKTEDFRAFVKRENNEEALIAQGDQMLMTLLQFGLIDATRYSNLFGRSTPTDVTSELRMAAKENQEKARLKGEADKEAVAQQQQLIQQAEAKQEARENKQFEQNVFMLNQSSRNRQDEIAAKSFGKIAEKDMEIIRTPQKIQ